MGNTKIDKIALIIGLFTFAAGLLALFLAIAVSFITFKPSESDIDLSTNNQNIDDYAISKVTFAEWQNRITKLEAQTDLLRRSDIENTFLANNEKLFEFDNYRFVHCCTNTGNETVSYDLKIIKEDGSNDDFGTTSYMSFSKFDEIESVDFENVGFLEGEPIVKVIVKTKFRTTEGIVYPSFNSVHKDFWYERLFDMPYDGNDYYVDVSFDRGIYVFNVKAGPENNPKKTAQFTLALDGLGNTVFEEVKSFEEPIVVVVPREDSF